MRVRKRRTQTVPVDLTTNDEAEVLATILGVSTSHRVYFLGSRAAGTEEQPTGWSGDGREYVFVYMRFPESGPYEWLKRAARRPQVSWEFSSPSYLEAWRASHRYCLGQAHKELRAEFDTTPPGGNS